MTRGCNHDEAQGGCQHNSPVMIKFLTSIINVFQR
jgi:hypothetical protein